MEHSRLSQVVQRFQDPQADRDGTPIEVVYRLRPDNLDGLYPWAPVFLSDMNLFKGLSKVILRSTTCVCFFTCTCSIIFPYCLLHFSISTLTPLYLRHMLLPFLLASSSCTSITVVTPPHALYCAMLNRTPLFNLPHASHHS